MHEKIDFKKTLASYRAVHGSFAILDVPPLQYLMIDGFGDPNTTEEYAEAVRALYTLSYKLKFASKRTLGRDYVVMPLEGLWWAANMDHFTTERDKSQWSWTMMIMTPDWITAEMLDSTVVALAAKGEPESFGQVRFETLNEGLCVQTLHIGSYDDEAAVLAEMHGSFIPESGLTMRGTHHEIYLSDPRKTAPEKLRTILRQPVSHQ